MRKINLILVVVMALLPFLGCAGKPNPNPQNPVERAQNILDTSKIVYDGAKATVADLCAKGKLNADQCTKFNGLTPKIDSGFTTAQSGIDVWKSSGHDSQDVFKLIADVLNLIAQLQSMQQ